eukprot:TRINITY_DN7831_c0_g2_i1.p1 TRINITY_DN7831_c0_g2~~TRINITY_DN7831_c0_g2_i1.p1  ORF type:complete len:108 (+),score=4.30 TRINITY_DN7831_c0_g2_i1:238-561(+)
MLIIFHRYHAIFEFVFPCEQIHFFDQIFTPPFFTIRLFRILLYEKFYFVTKGTAQVRTELYSYQVTLQGSEVFEKFNRTLIPNYIDMNQYRTERMNRLARIHQRGIS